MSKKLKTLGALALVTAMAPAASWAEDAASMGTFTGNAAIVSDYVFRGYTQNMEDPAIQGGFDWTSPSGFYLGTWGSNMQFGAAGEGSMEWDIYGGYAGAVDNFSYNIGLLAYLYPGTPGALNYDFYEAKLGLGYNFGAFSVSGGLNYTPDNFGGTDDAYYYSAGVSVPLTDQFSISGSYGYSALKAPLTDYSDWGLGATYTFPWFAADLRYYDTDAAGCANICDSRVVFKLSRTF